MAYKVIIVKLEICLLRCEILFQTDLIILSLQFTIVYEILQLHIFFIALTYKQS
jgi:hypothetical protein